MPAAFGTRRWLAIALVLAVLFPGESAAAVPRRSEHENWMTVIEEDGSRYCGPRGYLFSNQKVPDFQLRVMREKRQGHWRIAPVSPFR